MKLPKDDDSVARIALIVNDNKLAYDPEGAGDAANLSRSEVYRAINSGELPARKRGKRTFILREDLIEFLRKLPRLQEDNKTPVGGRR
jgi:hypothetical protein